MKRLFQIFEFTPDPRRDVREEIDAHIELERDGLVARGMHEDDAMRAAQARFGDREKFEAEAVREASSQQRTLRLRGSLVSVAHDLRLAVRRLATSPGFSLVTILTLAFGIGATSALFSVVHSILLSPLPFEHPEELFFATETRDEGSRIALVSALSFREWREATAGTLEMAAVREWPFNITDFDVPERLAGGQASPGLFSTLGVSLPVGREFTPEEERPGSGAVCLVSHAFWLTRLGGNPDLASLRVTLNGMSHAVVGVLPEGFEIAGVGPLPIVTPFPIDPAQSGFWSNHNAVVIARTAEGVNLERAQEELGSAAEALQASHPDWNDGIGARLIPMRELVVEGSSRGLWLLFSAIALVLLIACANIAGLLTARGAAAEQDMGVRIALGASRARIIRFSLSEALVLGTAGGLLGLGVCYFGAELFRRWAPEALPRMTEVSVNLPVVGFVAAVSLGTALLVGLVPAVHASHADTGDLLKAGIRDLGTRRRQRTQRFLVVGEVALAVALLVGSGLLGRTFVNLTRVDPGFHPEGRIALQVSLPQSSYPDREGVSAFLDRLHENLDRIPGVQASASSVGLPFQNQLWRKQITVAGQPAASLPEVPVVDLSIVTPGWLNALGIPLVRGRALQEGDNETAPFVALVNETFARTQFPNGDALGRRVRLAPPDHLLPDGQSTTFPWYTIVGVVGDVRRWDLAADPTPEVFISQRQDLDVAREFFVVARTSTPEGSVMAEMRRAVRDADPSQPVGWVRTMASMYSDMVALPRFSALLLAAFGIAALFLSVLGIYGMIANGVSARRREIGLRMALGAPRSKVLTDVVRDGVATASFGVVVGLLIAGAASRALASLLFGVAALDLATYLLVVAVVLSVAAAAALGPAWRAARLDPTVALRQG